MGGLEEGVLIQQRIEKMILPPSLFQRIRPSRSGYLVLEGGKLGHMRRQGVKITNGFGFKPVKPNP